MYSTEKNVAPRSPYFVYTPSALANRLFFYPTSLGHFRYLPGYHQKRANYDSYLYLLVEEGTFQILLDSDTVSVPAGRLVLFNCHEPHEYGSDAGCKILWLHFEGPLAAAYYEQIVTSYGNILCPSSYLSLHRDLSQLLDCFSENDIPDEADMSNRITGLLTPLLQSQAQKPAAGNSSNAAIRRVLNYILSHFQEDISLEFLASIAGLSPYHFSRVFKAEIGVSPHQYLIETRIQNAQYLLTSTSRPVNSIAYEVGFKDESAFCLSFRKRTGLTPSGFRSHTTKE